MTRRSLLCLLLFLLGLPPALAQSKNGFDLRDALVPPAKILHGGPPRDGIPAVDRPRFLAAAQAGLADDARVLGIARNGVAKAYPIAILNWHEIVNDEFAGEPIVVTFCPLCGTGMAFRAEVGGQPRHFGVSGLLYNSDVLLYDRESESLWTQIGQRAISGPLRGTTLEAVPVAHTAWADWRTRHPHTLVLSSATGQVRDYARDPYAGYAESPAVWFPTDPFGSRYHPKERVLGLSLGGQSKAYPFVELARLSGPLRDQFAGRSLTIEFDAGYGTARALDETGEELPAVIAYWFAWSAFHPDGAVFRAP
ncbi:MAG TPA: DUF3179 domain-containing protein [Candidatus Competibacteraceae bacterium]|nr:DUF3179 domain-containing protein [Candidatus Competibacteraceae bacterium]